MKMKKQVLIDHLTKRGHIRALCVVLQTNYETYLETRQDSTTEIYTVPMFPLIIDHEIIATERKLDQERVQCEKNHFRGRSYNAYDGNSLCPNFHKVMEVIPDKDSQHDLGSSVKCCSAFPSGKLKMKSVIKTIKVVSHFRQHMRDSMRTLTEMKEVTKILYKDKIHEQAALTEHPYKLAEWEERCTILENRTDAEYFIMVITTFMTTVKNDLEKYLHLQMTKAGVFIDTQQSTSSWFSVKWFTDAVLSLSKIALKSAKIMLDNLIKFSMFIIGNPQTAIWITDLLIEFKDASCRAVSVQFGLVDFQQVKEQSLSEQASQMTAAGRSLLLKTMDTSRLAASAGNVTKATLVAAAMLISGPAGLALGATTLAASTAVAGPIADIVASAVSKSVEKKLWEELMRTGFSNVIKLLNPMNCLKVELVN